MSDRFSHFPSCLRPPTTDHQSPAAAAPAPSSSNPNVTTSLYNTDLGLFALTWFRTFLGRSLHLQLHLDGSSSSAGSDVNILSLSPPPPSLSTQSFHLQIKPFIFWRKHGYKNFNSNNQTVQIFWDFRKAKFGSEPEPQSGFYIAVIVSGEMTLLVGDSTKEAYAKTKAEKTKRTQTLLMKREHVFGHRFYTTKAKFGGKNREITIECNNDNENPRLIFSVDGEKVLQIKRLKWKFRGNERIEVDGVHIQVSWDVYNWLFDDVVDGHAIFMFRFQKAFGFEDEIEEEILNNVDEKSNSNGSAMYCGFGINGIERKKMKKSLLMTTRSSSSSSISSGSSSGCSSSVMEWASMEEKELEGNSSGFSLLVYAWKS